MLQSLVRKFLLKRNFSKIRSATVSIQCRSRVKASVREFKRLRMAARDLGKLKNSNEEMKAEIDRLREAVALAKSAPASPLKSAVESELSSVEIIEEYVDVGNTVRESKRRPDHHISKMDSKERFMANLVTFRLKMTQVRKAANDALSM